MGFETGADILNIDVTRTGCGYQVGGAGGGDLVVNGDIAVEIAIVAFADSDVVAVLDDGWVAGDLLDAGIDITAAAHPAAIGVNVSDDVNPIVGAGPEANIARTCGDVEGWGAPDVEGAIEVAFGGEGRGGDGEGGNGEEVTDFHGELLNDSSGADFSAATGKYAGSSPRLRSRSIIYCWRITVSPGLRPARTSVLVPLEMPALISTLRRPFFCLGSGTSTEALRSLS